MTSADSYRKIAAELRARARKARSDKEAADLDNLARCYLRLAEQANTNGQLDLVAEFGPKNKLDDGI
jgi:hypothetical protein